MLISFFITLQVILLIIMTLHDWVHIPPLTDIRALEKHSTKKGRLINSTIFFFLVAIPLFLTWYYQPQLPLWVLISLVNFYGFLSLGTVLSWWVPYFFHSSEQHRKNFVEYKNTHHFLPPIRDNVIPNTFHVLMHLIIWTCFVLSLYLLF